jgi:CO/xanthine dehydrogenase Mo-binding subunit
MMTPWPRPAGAATPRVEPGPRRWIGKSVKRVEDPRLLRGKGRFIDDLKLPRMAHAAILRSPHAHARIVGIDTGAAERLPGVLRVLTGKDCRERMNALPSFAPGPIYQWAIAVDRVRHVGETVAAIVAENRRIAEDAVDLIQVEYEVLPAVVDPRKALEPGAAVLHEELGTNLTEARLMEFGDFEGAFAGAAEIVESDFYWGRSAAQPMDTNGAVASFDEGSGLLTIYCNSMSFSYLQWLLATSLKIPATKLKVVPMIAGGSFGSKVFQRKVPILAGFLAMASGRPVKYVEDRLTHASNSDHHGSDRRYHARLALDADGKMRGLDIDVIDDYGAYNQFAIGTHGNALAQVTGPYKMSGLRYAVKSVLTNKNQQGAYRGFGSEVGNFVLERLVDLAARKLKVDPVELRRKNLLQPDEFPYKILTGNYYDSGNYPAVLDKALKLSDYAGWRQRQAEARRQGRHLGIGLVTAQERSVFSSTEFWFWDKEPGFPMTSSPESATVTIDPTGQIIVTLHSQAMWGNSPETVAAQVVAEEFDVDPADVVVTYADSQHALPGTGPGGSRFTVMVTGALVGASHQLHEKMKRIVAKHLEADVHDLEFRGGKVQVKGVPDRAMTLGQVALHAYMFKLNLPEGMESGLEARTTYDHPFTTMPSEDRKDLGAFYPMMGHACHVAVVEVDPETGKVTFLKYAAVHDAGVLVNPMTLDGHITGGMAQGLGTAMYEEFAYDENGQPLSESFMDYLIPTALDVPRIDIDHHETPSPFTEYGIKGGGEGGRMMAPAVIASAIEDALAPLGVTVRELPITEAKIRRWIRGAQRGGGVTGSPSGI